MLILLKFNQVRHHQCFEKLAMSGYSTKSESVRMYFVKLREFLVENQQLIYQAMENKVDLDKYIYINTEVMILFIFLSLTKEIPIY